MEGVENINSVNTGGTSTVSTESQDLAPGQNDTEKKNHMFRHVVGLTHIFSTTTIKGVKMIKVVCKTEDAANKVMAKTIVVDNLTKFSKIESFTQNQPDLQSNFENKIWNVLLDIEKDLFEQHLLSLGQVKKIKFAVKNLYYEVSVTFVNKDLAGALKEEWSIKFLNKTFRIFPSTLTKEERNHCFKYVLKLTNLPKETNGGDLLEIFYFNSIDDMNAAKENHFAFNNKGLHFADKNALTCHTVYQNIYKRYKVEALKPKSGFKPIFPSAKDDFIPSDMKWADD
ncbi:hypothetical protein GLOIN_2v1778859 [Rhizophagus clarus]|uniref:Uncharacterized protein n=1 Tax=Rhizophagus clarus TaxID=94130 RepID=A0A8H3LQC0_9GLOM|nr:hypothetical protein GLOIN_2v1778859 [Rhizophagus clarus]